MVMFHGSDDLKFTEKGFTFLEVIVAVAIIAIVFTAALKMVSQTLALRSYTRFYSLAPYLASVADARIEKDGFMTGISGDFGSDFSGWTWSSEITRMSANDAYSWMNNLVRVRIKVRYAPENLDYNVVSYRVLQGQ